MEKNKYNQLLLSRLSALIPQLNQLVSDFKVETTEENFDLFKQWLELSHLNIDLINFYSNLGKKVHCEKILKKENGQLQNNSPKNSVFFLMNEEDYDKITKVKR